MEEPFERLQRARAEAGYANATDAARAFGWNINTYRSHENGERGLRKDAAERYASAFRVGVGWLLAGDGPRQRRNIAAVFGRIGAGAVIEPAEEQVPPEGLFEIEVPFEIPDDAIAFEVSGESQWPRYDAGDVIICWRAGNRAEDLLGWEAAVRTLDGQRYLKRIVRGSTKGTYDLESFNAPPIRGVKIDWAAEIHAVVRVGQWQKMNTAKLKAALKGR